MRCIATIIGLTLLGGCAYPVPVSMTADRTFFVYAANQEPLRTARCIVRNAEHRTAGYTASEARARDAYGWQVLVSDASGRRALAHVDTVSILVTVQPADGC